MIDHEAAVRAAALAELVGAILAAVTVEAGADTPDRLLSVDEAATMLGIGRSALYGEIAAGRLHSIKVGRRRLVPAAAIRDFIYIAADPDRDSGSAASREGRFNARRSV